MAIQPEIIQTIRDRVTLSEIVSETVTLKRSGRNLTGLCPFHSEKTPSFTVRDEEGTFHCFGCSKHGSAFDFLMLTRGWTFLEAVRFLARRVGVEIPEEDPARRAQVLEARKKKKGLLEVFQTAVKLYHELLGLPRFAQYREYLKRRGISEESIEKFKLGVAPDSDVLVRELTERLGEKFIQELAGKSLLQALRTVGLVTVKEGGRTYDTFRGRLLFPIPRSDGMFVALGGRLLETSPTRPKYINSIESPLYQKRKTFYGLATGLPSIRKAGEVYLVEGYMDVLALHQIGIENAIATCGTAVSPEHVLTMKRFTDRAIVVFDGDAAGMKAAAGCFEMFLNSGIDLHGVTLPENEDPGSLLETNRTDILQTFLQDQRKPIVDLYLNHLATTAYGGNESGSSPVLVGKAAASAGKLFARVKNPVEREFLMKRAAERFGVGVDSIRSLAKDRPSFTKSMPVQDRSDVTPVERVAPISRPTPRPKPLAEKPKRDVLSSYIKQLLVAIICEPKLAESVLDMPSFEDSPGVVEKLPDRVRAFLRSIAQTANLQGLESLKLSYEDPRSDDFLRGVEVLNSILARHELQSFGLMEEAQRQIQIGGNAPKKVVTDGPAVMARRSLLEEVEILRTQENNAQDSESLTRIVQEKLMKKRSMERLKS